MKWEGKMVTEVFQRVKIRVREIKNADKSLILPGDGESPVEVDVVSGSPAVDCD
jgi:hypothetical protein